eukprot:CAMPEP_0179002988 /NCGR_PEP_ID=MMETSP0795-20121207/12389_1 /TAXON_ID=88552 /ORGANISM="Amoebophrya sp., Strain Ameob2" /LENGTH=260 /DNA_ID=CAMNT_0020696869 /DNA_START=24 /DNA_END=802 /DNA_ORIENTATION=-
MNGGPMQRGGPANQNLGPSPLTKTDRKKQYMDRLDKGVRAAPQVGQVKQSHARMNFTNGAPEIVYGHQQRPYKLKQATGAEVSKLAAAMNDPKKYNEPGGNANARQSQIEYDPAMEGVNIQRKVGVMNPMTGVRTLGGKQTRKAYQRNAEGAWELLELPSAANDPSPPDRDFGQYAAGYNADGPGSGAAAPGSGGGAAPASGGGYAAPGSGVGGAKPPSGGGYAVPGSGINHAAAAAGPPGSGGGGFAPPGSGGGQMYTP